MKVDGILPPLEDLLVECLQGGSPRPVHLEACRWHLLAQDPRCLGCKAARENEITLDPATPATEQDDRPIKEDEVVW